MASLMGRSIPATEIFGAGPSNSGDRRARGFADCGAIALIAAMQARVRGGAIVRGTVSVPADKSIGHRLVLMSAWLEGSATLDRLPPGADVAASLDGVRRLGVTVTRHGSDADAGATLDSPGIDAWTPSGPIARDGRLQLDCANSGTTTRLLSGLLATSSLRCVLDGDASLRTRPMARVVDPLRAHGAAIATHEGRLPIRVDGVGRGVLRAINYRAAVASAQVKSALLIAGLRSTGENGYIEPILSRDHTERIFAVLGVPMTRMRVNDFGYHRVEWKPWDAPGREARAWSVPGDPSSAAFWWCAAAGTPSAEVTTPEVALNPTRVALLDVLREWGAEVLLRNVREVHSEPVGDVTVYGADVLDGGAIGEKRVPWLIDELPMLIVLAARTRNGLDLTGASELRVKESDRLEAIARVLDAWGIASTLRADGIVVRPASRWKGAAVDAAGDHRIAMAAAIGALWAEGVTTIAGADSVGISYPAFWTDLATLSGAVEV